MIDGRILPLQQKILHPIAKLLVRLGVRADQITIAGFLVGLIALPMIATPQAGVYRCAGQMVGARRPEMWVL